MLVFRSDNSHADQLEGMLSYWLPERMLILSQSNVGLGENPNDEQNDWPDYAPSNGTAPGHEWLDLISDANSYLTVHLLFTYLFTLLALRFTYKNYRRFIRARQLFTLELVHSISARTVMVTDLPNHLQSERSLAEYFENMELTVESVSVCREVGTLKAFLDQRTEALLKLETEWVKYVGNPSSAENYDPSDNAVPGDGGEPSALEGQPGRLIVPHRKRPTLRPGWFKAKVDALEYLEGRFKEADEKVKKWRKHGKFRSSHCAFVTFEKMSSAVRPNRAFRSCLFQSKFFTHTANRDPSSACSPPRPMQHVPSPGAA